MLIWSRERWAMSHWLFGRAARCGIFRDVAAKWHSRTVLCRSGDKNRYHSSFATRRIMPCHPPIVMSVVKRNATLPVLWEFCRHTLIVNHKPWTVRFTCSFLQFIWDYTRLLLPYPNKQPDVGRFDQLAVISRGDYCDEELRSRSKRNNHAGAH